MIDRENEFFGDIKSENLEETNTSSTGINYGEKTDKAGMKNIIIAVSAGAVFAAILVLLLSPKKDNRDVNNFAEIPTLSQPTGPIKIQPTNQISSATPDVFETATIYNIPTETQNEPIVQPQVVEPAPVVKSVTPAPAPAKPVVKTVKKVQPAKKPAKVEVKKPAPAPVAKAKSESKISVPEKEIVETKTNIPGEVELSLVTPTTGIWNVQLVSTSSESAAQNEWENLSKKYPAILGGKSHTVSKTEINGKTYYRLRVSNIATSDEATNICNQLKTYKLSCFVTK
ncbi:MAG: SPOR domain-containing protein [Alphaproteobacteria bacterium]